MSSIFDDSVDEAGAELGLKLGFGPIADSPVYIVGEIGGMGHRFEDYYGDYLQFNSYLLGGGIIIYPIPLIQIGASIGYSYIANQTSLAMYLYDSQGGFAYNASIALDFGKKKHGLLIGAKYFYAENTLEVSNVLEKASEVCVFVRYAYRVKNNPSSF